MHSEVLLDMLTSNEEAMLQYFLSFQNLAAVHSGISTQTSF